MRPTSAGIECAADAWYAARLHATRHGAAGLAFLIACAGRLAIPFVWFSLSLHVRRIRDIGWDPVVVLVGVVALNVGDAALARLVPGLAHGRHGGTIFGGLLNGAPSLALLFWPIGDEALSAPPSIPRARDEGRVPPPRSMPTTRRAGFGRRGLG